MSNLRIGFVRDAALLYLCFGAKNIYGSCNLTCYQQDKVSAMSYLCSQDVCKFVGT